MPRGKKFDAAEKHFEKKCVEWRQKLRELEYDNNRLREENYTLRKEWEDMRARLTILEGELIELKNLNRLSEDELRLLIEHTKTSKQMLSIFEAMGSLPRTF